MQQPCVLIVSVVRVPKDLGGVFIILLLGKIALLFRTDVWVHGCGSLAAGLCVQPAE